MTKKAIIILATGFEETEALTPVDMLRRAGVQVTIAGVESNIVTGSHEITVIADKKFSEVKESFDACLLPGGPAAKILAATPAVNALIQKMHQQGKLIAAICAAPALVLAPLGILQNKSATCFAGMEDHFPTDARFVAAPVVVDGNLITSRGPATALLFGLAIVEKLVDKDMSDKLRKATMLDAPAD